MAFLEFMFQSAFHFIGMIMLIWLVMAGLACIAGAARGNNQ
ncbi:hypothetical protein [Brucella intermedia]|nr:hypothetical protein [Brucella intermedia]